MSKRGRPKKEDTRTYCYRIRLNTEEKLQLDDLQQICNIPKAQIIRTAILDYHKKIKKQQRKETI